MLITFALQSLETITLNALNISVVERDRRVVYQYLMGGTENKHLSTDLEVEVEWAHLDENEVAQVSFVWAALRKGERVLVSIVDAAIFDVEMVMETDERNVWGARIGRVVPQQLRLISRHNYEQTPVLLWGFGTWGQGNWN